MSFFSLHRERKSLSEKGGLSQHRARKPSGPPSSLSALSHPHPQGWKLSEAAAALTLTIALPSAGLQVRERVGFREDRPAQRSCLWRKFPLCGREKGWLVTINTVTKVGEEVVAQGRGLGREGCVDSSSEFFSQGKENP